MDRKLLQARLLAAAREDEAVGVLLRAHAGVVDSLAAALMRRGWSSDETTLAIVDVLDEERKQLLNALVP